MGEPVATLQQAIRIHHAYLVLPHFFPQTVMIGRFLSPS